MNWKDFFIKNKHFLFIFYLPLYMYCFTWLEARDDVPFTDIHCFVDDWIPFCEIFIIPYCTPVPFCAEESSGRLLSLCECADTWDEHLPSGVLSLP